MEQKKKLLSCIDCASRACDEEGKTHPPFCVSQHIETEFVDEIKGKYEDKLIANIMRSSAVVEFDHYCQLTRVEETIAWAKEMGAKKIGIATCVGLLSESRTFAKILRHHGFEVYGVGCKVGEVHKTDLGIPERCEGIGEHACNPIMQAALLAKEETDLNVLIGLCVGHDSLFYAHSKAPVTTLVCKDRVLGHNPVAALYTAEGYYKGKLFGSEE